MLKYLRSRFYKWTERKINVSIQALLPLERLGTAYGGWIIPEGMLNSTSIVYLVGAGEDVSFDVAVAGKYGCAVHIVDPTPRAVAHVQQLQNSIRTGVDMPLANTPSGKYPSYPLEIADLLHIHPIGLWSETTTLRFFKPENEAHISHSLVNLQKTEAFIEVPVCRLSELMQKERHTHIDLLKIDIEGAEYTVLQTILEDKIPVNVLCIEYDESHANHLDGGYIGRIEASLQSLEKVGFKVVAREPNCHNYTLVHERVL
ncbi:MAG: FkbM family methyltransferase [Saprospiraceae bacterium]|nr:FkbM family methyltransferase [Saprospiraceae bacterium]